MNCLVSGLLVLVTSTALLAQSESPDCYDATEYFSDTGCSNSIQCPGVTGECTASTFVPDCTGNYFLDIWTTCEITTCAHCMACVSIHEGTTLLTSCKTSDCVNGSQYRCRSYGAVSLTQGHTYSVQVCLTRCPGDNTCEVCGDNQYRCMAHACLRFSQASPCCGS